ncbi:MAG: hypothetical protein WDW38_011366 [Sanguina aurantia]
MEAFELFSLLHKHTLAPGGPPPRDGAPSSLLPLYRAQATQLAGRRRSQQHHHPLAGRPETVAATPPHSRRPAGNGRSNTTTLSPAGRPETVAATPPHSRPLAGNGRSNTTTLSPAREPALWAGRVSRTAHTLLSSPSSPITSQLLQQQLRPDTSQAPQTRVGPASLEGAVPHREHERLSDTVAQDGDDQSAHSRRRA